MRINMLVTANETKVPSGVFIYSRTDTNGIIIEANQTLADISGYAIDEMVGQPHNLLRHPDMPSEAFKDLWGRLKSERHWIGLVKNRRKDGGFYWVKATVTPVRENGNVVGYQSVRAAPTQAQIGAADAIYARIRAGDETVAFVNGRIVDFDETASRRA